MGFTHPKLTTNIIEPNSQKANRMKFWQYDRRDIWKLILVIVGLIYGIYDHSAVIVFFGSGALISWAFQMAIKIRSRK